MKNNKPWLVRLERIAKTSCLFSALCLWALIVVLQFAASPARADPRPANGDVPGPYAVGHTSFVSAMDSGRPVAVNVWYPADPRRITRRSREAVYVMDPYTFEVGSATSSDWEALGYARTYESPAPADGPFPLVMFSPGFMLPYFSYMYLATRLASYGYVVAVVEHFNDGVWLSSGWDGVPMALYNRPRDLSFALTEILAKDRQRGDPLYQTIDRRNIVAAGHSFGGYAAMVEFSGDDQVCDSAAVDDLGDPIPPEACHATPADGRFTALLTLDPSSDVLRWEEISRIRVPSLLLGNGANADWDFANANDRAWNARPHAALCTRTRSVRVDIGNIEHLSFGAPDDGYTVLRNAHLWSQEDYKFYSQAWGSDERIPAGEAHRIVVKYALAWLSSEVVEDGSPLSERILTQEYAIAHEPAVELWWDERVRTKGPSRPGTFTYFIDMDGNWAVADKNPADWFIACP